jgi:hypothetical protein
MILGIALSFLLLAAGILWFVIGSKGWVILKAFMIVIVCASAITVFNTLQSFKGWPALDNTPQKFMIKWVDVHEPKGTYEGDIFVWISKPPKYVLKEPLKEKNNFLYYKGEDHEPRAYRIPYSKEMHKMMQKAKAALKKGQPVMVDKGSKKGKSGGKGDKDGKDGKDRPGLKGKGEAKGEMLGSWNFSGDQKWEFHVLPPPKLPRKVFE